MPGNASSLSETHGSWTVQCVVALSAGGSKAKRCTLSQQQVAQNTGQRALTIELTAESGIATGNLVLPFGLDLQKGVAFQLDEEAVGNTQHFRTCLPAGCIIDVNFNADMIASLKAGTVLKIRSAPVGGEEIIFSISLTGFTSACDRVAELLEM